MYFGGGVSLSFDQFFVTMDYSPARFPCPWGFPGRNTGVGCHFLLQGIFLTQGSNLSLLKVSCITGRFFSTEPPGKTIYIKVYKDIYLNHFVVQLKLTQHCIFLLE